MGRDNRGSSPPTRGDGEPTTGRAITDPLTSVDDLLRETNKQLAELTTAIRRGDGVTVPDSPEVGGTAGGGRYPDQDDPPIYPYDFSRVVPGQTLRDTPETDTFVVPRAGAIRRVVLGWPTGTQQAVGIGLDTADSQSLIPRGPKDAKYLAYNDQVLSFDVNESVGDDEEIQIRFVNNDSADHFVNVEIFFQAQNAD